MICLPAVWPNAGITRMRPCWSDDMGAHRTIVHGSARREFAKPVCAGPGRAYLNRLRFALM